MYTTISRIIQACYSFPKSITLSKHLRCNMIRRLLHFEHFFVLSLHKFLKFDAKSGLFLLDQKIRTNGNQGSPSFFATSLPRVPRLVALILGSMCVNRTPKTLPEQILNNRRGGACEANLYSMISWRALPTVYPTCAWVNRGEE